MRRREPIVLLIVFLLGLVGFEDSLSAGDAETDVRERLMQADRDFDRATAEAGTEGWVSYFAEDGLMFGNDGRITMGAEAIREAMEPAFANPDFSLRWEPVDADVSSADDLGYTHGKYTLTTTNPEGEQVTLYGKYVTIWKKQPDGAWRVVVDIGTAPRPAPEPPEAN
jgi:uncharacterized protein (TIGR02246 family)